jgi:hypothetical protein
MDSIIEVQRQAHEEAERYEQALAEILIKPTTGVSGTAECSGRRPPFAYDDLWGVLTDPRNPEE